MKKIIILLIIVLAFFLRFYRLAEYPALNADEAAIAYNAYSLIETGKDEHGVSWPIHFQSFNDFKPGLYFYLAIPFIKFLGLSELAVRIPGALLGVTNVLVLYLLVKKLFKDEVLALTSSFFLAISPWHLHFSRGAWEVNVATFFIVLGIYLFIKGLDSKKLTVLSVISFALSLYTYHAARVVVPLLLLSLLVIYQKEVKENLKRYLLAAVIGFLILLPLGSDLLRGSVFSRAAGVGIFSDPGPLARINEQRSEHQSINNLGVKLLHNKPINYTLAIVENWAEHFWGEFLFLSGDEIQRNRVPDTGQMYLFDILFLITGFVAIIKRPKNWEIILAWVIIAPLAAALTFQSPHALRSQNLVVPLVIISASGLIYLSKSLHAAFSKKLLNVLFGIFLLFVAWNFTHYLHMYWVHMAKEYPFSSQYGVKELVSYISEVEDKYDNVIVTDRYDQPYIMFLFYQKYSPEKFQKDHNLTAADEYGFSTVNKYGKYVFQAIDFDDIKVKYPKSLIIGTNEEIPIEANIIKTIKFPNDQPAFRIVAN